MKQAPTVEKFFPVVCPACNRTIGEIATGMSRCQCSQCKQKYLVWHDQARCIIYIVLEKSLCNTSQQGATS